MRLFWIGILACAIPLSTSYAASSADATLKKPAVRYEPTPTDLAYTGVTPGDLAIARVRAIGTALQYTGLVLTGDGVNADGLHPFLKVQEQDGGGSFDHGACYLGNNSSAGQFGLGFFTLSQPFKTAVMAAFRSGSTVTILLQNVNEGKLPNQTYVCSGAPTPPGSSIGVVGYAAHTSTLDNFRACEGVILDTFSYTGTLGSSGNWFDAAPGMYANGTDARGGPLALSFWVPSLAPCTTP